MHDVRACKTISGLQKKKLVTDTLVHAVRVAFKVLNETNPVFEDNTWGEEVEAIIVCMIDLLVRVDNGEVRFH